MVGARSRSEGFEEVVEVSGDDFGRGAVEEVSVPGEVDADDVGDGGLEAVGVGVGEHSAECGVSAQEEDGGRDGGPDRGFVVVGHPGASERGIEGLGVEVGEASGGEAEGGGVAEAFEGDGAVRCGHVGASELACDLGEGPVVAGERAHGAEDGFVGGLLEFGEVVGGRGVFEDGGEDEVG